MGGRRLVSVTTALKAIAKPNLLPWAVKLERASVVEAAVAVYAAGVPDVFGLSVEPMSSEDFAAALEAKLPRERAHEAALKCAGTVGTRVHAAIEHVLRTQLGEDVGEAPPLEGPAAVAFAAWDRWRRLVRLEATAVERVVHSENYGFAGTLDALGAVNYGGKRLDVILDWKSGGSIYPEASLQAAAYWQAAIEEGLVHEPPAGLVVRVPKYPGEPVEAKLLPADEMPRLLEAFLHVLAVWNWTDAQGVA